MKITEVVFGVKSDLEKDEFKRLSKQFGWENLPWSRKWEYPYAILKSGLSKGMRVLDAGTGQSRFPLALLELGCEVSCVDKEVVRLKGVSTWQCDIRDLPFPDGFFDVVFCLSVLEHTERLPIDYIDELGRVLKSDGVLVVTFDYNRWDSGNGYRFKYGEVEVLLSKFGKKFPEMPANVLKSEETEDGKKFDAGLSVIGCVFKKE